MECRIDGFKWDGLELLDVQIGLPTVKVQTESVPGADGVLDLTEALNGEAVYGNRNIKLQFGFSPYGNFNFYEFAGMVHGKRLKLELGNKNGYYIGRFTVGDIDKSKKMTMFYVNVDADPFCLEAAETSITIPCVSRSTNVMLGGAATIVAEDIQGTAAVSGAGANTVLSVDGISAQTGYYKNSAVFKLPWPEDGSCLISADVTNGYYEVVNASGQVYGDGLSRWITDIPANGLYIRLAAYGGPVGYGKLRNIQIFKGRPGNLDMLSSDRLLYPTVTWSGDTVTYVPSDRLLPLAPLEGNETTSPYLQIHRRAANTAYAIGDAEGTITLTGRRGWV